MRFALAIPAAFCATAALAQGIVPNDGTWLTKTDSVSFADSCSGQIKPLLEPMANAMLNEETQEISFDGTFDPRKIDPENQSNVTWTQIDDNTWQGSMPNPATGQGVVAIVRTQVISPDRIEGQIQMDIEQLFASDPEMEPMRAMAAGCAITIATVSSHKG